MNISARSYLTTGVAALGVGAIALTPIQPLPNQVALAPQHAVNTLSVELAAAINPIQPVIDTVQASIASFQGLLANWKAGLYVDGVFPYPENTNLNGQLGSRTGGYKSGERYPFILQVLTNQQSYLAQLPALGDIVKEMIGNVGNAITSPFTPGEDLRGTVLGIPGQYNQNVNGFIFNATIPGAPINQRTVLALLPVLAPAVATALKPVLNFATTPISGLLLGAIGPVLGPVLSAVDSVKAIITDIKEGRWADAINDTINIPTHMVDAFLNGGPSLNLTKILGNILPDNVRAIGVKMGGILSPGGVAADGITAIADATIPGVGTLTLDVPGNAVGPIGAFQGLTNYMAKSILPPQAVEPGASRRAKAAAAADSSDEAPAPKQLRRAERKAAGSASSGRAPRSAAARHAR